MCGDEHRTIRLTEDAYQRLESHNRADETISDTVERIAGERSLLDLKGILSDSEAERLREAIRERESHLRDDLD